MIGIEFRHRNTLILGHNCYSFLLRNNLRLLFTSQSSVWICLRLTHGDACKNNENGISPDENPFLFDFSFAYTALRPSAHSVSQSVSAKIPPEIFNFYSSFVTDFTSCRTVVHETGYGSPTVFIYFATTGKANKLLKCSYRMWPVYLYCLHQRLFSLLPQAV